MWLADAAAKGARLRWTNEVRTLSSRGKTYIDCNHLKKIVSGGDPIETRKNNQNPYFVRHEFIMSLDVNDLPTVRPAIGGTFLRVFFPNQYANVPILPNEKAKDANLKRRIAAPSFANGMPWLVLDE
jgi:phage/plasmid-associated DNA primase